MQIETLREIQEFSQQVNNVLLHHINAVRGSISYRC